MRLTRREFLIALGGLVAGAGGMEMIKVGRGIQISNGIVIGVPGVHVSGDGGLLSQITAWQTGMSTVSGGFPEAGWAAGQTSLGMSVITMISGIVSERIRQDGFVRAVKAYITSTGPAQMRFRVFRPNGSNYDFVSQSELITPLGTGSQTFVLAQPMACRTGDVLGVYLAGGGSGPCIGGKTGAAANAIRYVSGDITSSNAFASLSNHSLMIAAYTNLPWAATTGDSIAEGMNSGGDGWQSWLDTNGPAGTQSKEIFHQLRGLVGDGTVMQYQNNALQAQDMSWVATTGAVKALATGCRVLWIHCGTNDLRNGRTWSQIQADLNTIKGLLGVNQRILLDEILPRTDSSDAEVALQRAVNANFATWCAANGATLVRCRDAMGQLRASTGFLDDLATAYSQDGTHLTQAGTDKMASLILPYLAAVA